jgi:hypothetical protein
MDTRTEEAQMRSKAVAQKNPELAGDSEARTRRTTRASSFVDSDGKRRAIPTPLKAIRLRCLDCCCFQPSEVRRCPSEGCPLWPWRMGRRPKAEDLKGQ